MNAGNNVIELPPKGGGFENQTLDELFDEAMSYGKVRVSQTKISINAPAERKFYCVIELFNKGGIELKVDSDYHCPSMQYALYQANNNAKKAMKMIDGGK